jgi:LPS-assembly protein
LENQVIYRFSKDFVLHNTLFYSHKYDRIKKLQTGMSYKNDKVDFGLNHTYEYKPSEKNTNFITTRFNTKVSSKYAVFGSLDYDLEESFTKEWTLGWHMKKRCWDYKFRYKESVTPSLTSAGTESLVKRGILLFVRFSPFGGMAYNFNHESKLNLEHIEGLE